MTRFAKLFFWFLAAVLLLWQLPWAIGYLTAKPANTPFTLYSEVLGDFVMIRYHDKEAEYLDRRGMSYSHREFDSLLPLFYARQLVADNRFPDSVAGRPVTLREVQQASFIFRSTPKDLNRPSPGIHFLLESLSGRVDLTMPSDAFRLTERGIEFIDMASNRIDSAKSARFTATMRRKGMRFPVRERSAWHIRVFSFWMNCRSLTEAYWKCCGSRWRTGRSRYPERTGHTGSLQNLC